MDDDEGVEREERQLSLMLDRVERFRQGALGIGSVINDLEALLNELELVSDDWRGEFIDAWGELEIPYAVALDRMQELPTAQDATVSAGLDAIDRLIRGRLPVLALARQKQSTALEALPETLRETAVRFGNDEWGWSRDQVGAALQALSAAGVRVVGLDLRSDGTGTAAAPATELPVWAAADGIVRVDANRLAVEALPSSDQFPAYQWVLVTWCIDPVVRETGPVGS